EIWAVDAVCVRFSTGAKPHPARLCLEHNCAPGIGSQLGRDRQARLRSDLRTNSGGTQGGRRTNGGTADHHRATREANHSFLLNPALIVDYLRLGSRRNFWRHDDAESDLAALPLGRKGRRGTAIYGAHAMQEETVEQALKRFILAKIGATP